MNRRRFTIGIMAFAEWASRFGRGARGAVGSGSTEDVSDDDSSKNDSSKNDPSKTLGGRQFWRDELFFHEWHVQRHVVTGHCRLLDCADKRHASGTMETCVAELEKDRKSVV